MVPLSWKVAAFFFGLGAVAAGAAEEALHEVEELVAMQVDDECDAKALGEGGAGSSQGSGCGLAALQLRGERVMREMGPDHYVQRTLVADEGHQLEAQSVDSVAACEALCSRNSACLSFTFGKGSNWGKCFLKDRSVTASDPSSTNGWSTQNFETYYKVGAVDGYIGRTLVADEGKQLAARNVNSMAECASFCDATSACRSFTFGVGSQQGKCFLKDGKVTADSASTPTAWNREHFMTYYKAASRHPSPSPRPHHSSVPTPAASKVPSSTKVSSEYVRARSCKPAAVITQAYMCTAAAEALGIEPSRPRVVPPEDGTLPPGCLVGPGLRDMEAGMWYNSMGLQPGFFSPEMKGDVSGDDSFELICKRKPYAMAAEGSGCSDGDAVSKMEECTQAAEALGIAPPQNVPESMMWTSPKGCYTAKGAMWFNSAPMSFHAGNAPGVQAICRTP